MCVHVRVRVRVHVRMRVRVRVRGRVVLACRVFNEGRLCLVSVPAAVAYA